MKRICLYYVRPKGMPLIENHKIECNLKTFIFGQNESYFAKSELLIVIALWIREGYGKIMKSSVCAKLYFKTVERGDSIVQ